MTVVERWELLEKEYQSITDENKRLKWLEEKGKLLIALNQIIKEREEQLKV